MPVKLVKAMLTIYGERQGRFCDGISRRSLLKVGGLMMGGLSLPQLLQAETQAGIGRSHKAIIMVFLPGGPPHLDMFDLKPDAPIEVRGEFKPIRTNVRGIEICELMPQLARIMDKLVIVRSIADCVNEHTSWHCLTGYSKSDSVQQGGRPSIGSVISKLQGSVDEKAIPPAIDLTMEMKIKDWQNPGPGFLGPSHPSFQPMPLPGWRKEYPSPWLPGPGDLPEMALKVGGKRFRGRKALLQSFDNLRRNIDTQSEIRAMDTFQEQAFAVLTSSKLGNALDVTQEDPKLRERYGYGSPQRTDSVSGDNPHGGALWNDQFLMARRLVEAGARCVTITFGAWDFHSKNFKGCRWQLPPLDQALSALIEDLHARGLDQDVTVVVWGEFGRAPRIEGDGRNHWPSASFALLAGGGMRTGQVIGSTNRLGEHPQDRPVKIQNVFATLYHNLGINPARIIANHLGRPVSLLDDCNPISELI